MLERQPLRMALPMKSLFGEAAHGTLSGPSERFAFTDLDDQLSIIMNTAGRSPRKSRRTLR